MWVLAPIGVLVVLVGTFLAVLFWGGAEKFIVQLFGLEEGQKYEALKFSASAWAARCSPCKP